MFGPSSSGCLDDANIKLEGVGVDLEEVTERREDE